MTSLFRPWAENTTLKSSREDMTSLSEKPNSEVACELFTREDKYKSVKEHMKKRSEKYFLKKVKIRNEKTAEKSEVNSSSLNANRSFPLCCAPPDPYLHPLDCIIPPNGSIPVYTGTEFIETAINQGFPPVVFEEYAKLLTEQQRIVSERNRKQRPKKFKCPHCHVGFSNNGQLKGHIRIHTGERPFKCDAESCGKSFTRNEELTRHRRIHSGLRPFPCSECGKRFGRKDHLKKHVKTHFQQRYQLVPILPNHYSYIYGL